MATGKGYLFMLRDHGRRVRQVWRLGETQADLLREGTRSCREACDLLAGRRKKTARRG